AATVLPMLLVGALLLVSILFLGLSLFYQRQAHWILFLFLCLAASSLLLAEAWRDLFGYLYPFHLVRLYIVMGLSCLFSVLLPTYFLMYYRFQDVTLWVLLLMLVTIAVSFFSPYFDMKSTMMFGVSLLASFAINLRAYHHKRSGSGIGILIALFSFALLLIPAFRFAETGFALIVCFLLFTILLQLLRQFTRDKEKAALATQLENQLLRRTLQPHFLMNSLSLIGELLHQSPQQAETFIQALGREFRMLNEYADSPTIALVQELELCKNYLEIMSTRLQSVCQLHVDGDPSGIAIPPAILLTVLENAFSHNKYRQETRFDLLIVREKNMIKMTLKMPVASPRAHTGTGTGNQYIQQSLQEVFDGRASYTHEQRDSTWYAQIQIPPSTFA
ncbi:MAG: histidine kinase, partial [Undibacterium sp.]|nr:histidine kinase [Undibacterium sp.]